MFSFLLYIVYFFTFLYINFQKVLKGMKGEHVIGVTGDAKDTGAKGKCNSAEENLKWK